MKMRLVRRNVNLKFVTPQPNTLLLHASVNWNFVDMKNLNE